jgi:hypothetical protein
MFDKYITDPSQGFWQPSYHLHILFVAKVPNNSLVAQCLLECLLVDE